MRIETETDVQDDILLAYMRVFGAWDIAKYPEGYHLLVTRFIHILAV